MKPLKEYNLPSLDSQNCFGAKRKHDFHTGVDLFCQEHEGVYSMYDGVVTNVIEFTGFSESPWWNDTLAVMIYHPDKQKTFLYGEVETNLKPGKVVKAGDLIAKVKKVLKKDKGKPTTMLHMECYKGLQTSAVWWYHNQKCPNNLEDITKYL